MLWPLYLAKGIAGRFERSEHGLHPLQITAAKFSFAWLLWVVVLAVTTQNAVGTLASAYRPIVLWLADSELDFLGQLANGLADATTISFLTPVFTFVLAVIFLGEKVGPVRISACLLYTSPSPRDRQKSRMPSSA